MGLDELLTGRGIRPIRGGYVSPTAEELADVVAAVGAALPADYRRFLLAYGRSGFEGLVGVRSAADGTLLPFLLFYGGGD